MKKQTFTVDQLLTAIRKAESLDELKYMVGPSDENEALSGQRLARIDRLFNSYGSDMSTWPWHARDTYERLNNEQRDFENTYC
ncbi:hypothetical protein [Chitinimonas sp. BJB300]|uniref:hypothetical protein n=1 Tax=Chitinimonas sp. BJB300 TaxID=1559339 RepID=UPI000C0D7549|nr:hypothetical protein [Chitinimonas sp. BJB300]PHV10896.1 hypothetical protein CSQ89_13770 [Chitinimonas sp. BJB300]TSJ88183.1 hypothetical protein FG002_011775 [Chitinimonas sp. BJB300]